MTDSNATAQVHVSVRQPEEAYNGNAEFWCGNELMAVTITRRAVGARLDAQ